MGGLLLQTGITEDQKILVKNGTAKITEALFDEPTLCTAVEISMQKYRLTIHPKEQSITVQNKKGEHECRKISIKTLMETWKKAIKK